VLLLVVAVVVVVVVTPQPLPDAWQLFIISPPAGDGITSGSIGPASNAATVEDLFILLLQLLLLLLLTTTMTVSWVRRGKV